MRVKHTTAAFKVDSLLVTQLDIVQNYVIVNVRACMGYRKYHNS